MSRQRGPSVRVCIFGDACDRAAAQQLLATLPGDAYGHVFIVSDSVVSDSIAPALTVPERVQVTRLLPREGGCPLAEAMSAWAAEWLPGGGSPVDAPKVWVLPGACSRLAGGGHDCVTRLLTALPEDQLIQG